MTGLRLWNRDNLVVAVRTAIVCIASYLAGSGFTSLFHAGIWSVVSGIVVLQATLEDTWGCGPAAAPRTRELVKARLENGAIIGPPSVDDDPHSIGDDPSRRRPDPGRGRVCLRPACDRDDQSAFFRPIAA
jgi:hypothetical protein